MTPAYAKLAFLVDVFLTMSGFLLAHQFLSNKKQMENIKNSNFGKNLKLFGKMVLKRYLR
jgi:peptidoglycan/LPS O-acetylase OafA/YrhL